MYCRVVHGACIVNLTINVGHVGGSMHSSVVSFVDNLSASREVQHVLEETNYLGP